MIVIMLLMPVTAFAEDEITGGVSADNNIYALTPDDISNDDLLMQYIEKKVPSVSGPVRLRAKASKRRNTLSDNDKALYDALEVAAAETAAGERSNTEITIPIDAVFGDAFTYTDGRWRVSKETLGVDQILIRDEQTGELIISPEAKSAFEELTGYDGWAVLEALLADHPYECYWLDKTQDISFGFMNAGYAASGSGFSYPEEPYFYYALPVAASYSKDQRIGTTEADTSRTGAASTCVDTVTQILADSSALPDKEKLYAYKDIICDSTEYDRTAVNAEAYGDPWQLIYIFDGDPETKVVCEGYSKAFQFLCDRSDFSDDRIECHTVTGEVAFSKGGTAYGHMWNILHMDDGRNYLADITHCDEGTAEESSDGLFLKGYLRGSLEEGFSFSSVGAGITDHIYTYDEETRSLYSDEELDLSFEDYTEGTDSDPADEECTHQYGDWETVTPATCTASGLEKRVCSLDPSHEETREIPPLGHELRHVPSKPATCREEGMKEHYVCTVCSVLFSDPAGESVIEDESSLVTARSGQHSWNSGVVTLEPTCKATGVMTYTCETCNARKTEYLPKAGHELQHHPEQAATTEADGTKEHYECTVCGRMFLDSEAENETGLSALVIPKLSSETPPEQPQEDPSAEEPSGQKEETAGTPEKPASVQPLKLKATRITKLKRARKALTVKWKKLPAAELKNITGYQIQYSLKSNFRKAKLISIKKTKASKKIGKLKAGTKYYVRVRTYRNKDGKRVYSKWSKAKSARTR